MSSALDTMAAAAQLQRLRVQADKAQAYHLGYRRGALRALVLGVAIGTATTGLLAWLVYIVATAGGKLPC